MRLSFYKLKKCDYSRDFYQSSCLSLVFKSKLFEERTGRPLNLALLTHRHKPIKIACC